MAIVTRRGQHRLADPNSALGAGETSLYNPNRSNLDYAGALGRVTDAAEAAGTEIHDFINQAGDQITAILVGLGFEEDDVEPFIQFLENMLTPQSPLDWANLLGPQPDWLLPSSIDLGALTQQPVNRIADPKFTAAVDASSGRWTHDTTTFRSPDRSLKVSGTGQGTQLRSNIIKVRPGQVVTVTINVAAKDLVGAGTDLLELNVLPFVGTGTDAVTPGNPINIAHIGAPNGSVSAWTAMPNGAGGATLTGSWVVTGMFTDGVALMFGVTDNLVGGDTWWDDAVMTLSATTIPQGWVTDLVNDGLQWSNDIANAQTWLTQIGQIFDNQVVTPINAWVQKIKDYWASSVGPAAVAANRAYQTRMAQNDVIIRDWLHKDYPAGWITDTAATRIGGKPTWWGAVNDNSLAVAQMLGLAPPPTPTTDGADVGTFALTTQTRVITNESTLAQVQADVDALKTADTSVAGRKYLVSASGGTAASWGAPWTTTATNGNIMADSQNDLYAVSTAASSAIDLTLQGIFNAGTTLTWDQIISVVFQEAATNMAGGLGPRNKIKGRMSTDQENYVWAEVNYNRVQLGCCVNGNETVWATQNNVSVPAGALFELRCGSSTSHRAYQVLIGGKVVITYAEPGTVSMLGDNYVSGGQDMTASHGLANDVFRPARVKQFKLQDSNAAASTYGTSARWYRSSTSGVLVPKAAVVSMGGNVYDANPEYASADIKMFATGFAFYTPGRYRMTHATKVSAATASPWAWSAIAAGTAYASVNQITNVGGSPTVVSKASSKYDAAAVLGLGGSFSFNAKGDGTASELWAPSIAVAGSGNYSVLGDGGGEGTWVVIERID